MFHGGYPIIRWSTTFALYLKTKRTYIYKQYHENNILLLLIIFIIFAQYQYYCSVEQILSALLGTVKVKVLLKLKVLLLQSNWFVERFRYHSPVI